MGFSCALGSLFDGLGGWQIAAMRAGIQPIWSSEIEKFPLALTKTRFPTTKQLGDITQIDGGAIPPVDIITMGSPCQDLSMAGRREGLAGERSGLFIRAVELIRQMGTATQGQYPKIAIWENVPGAFISNKGLDFKTVLETFTEADIPMPRSGNGQNQEWCEVESVTSSGGHWMPDFGESPNVAVECSLSSIIQKKITSKKYYLSPKACLGILQRAKKYGVKLDDRLMSVLTKQSYSI